MKKLIVFAALLLLCCALVSCDLFGGKDEDPQNGDGGNNQWKSVSHDEVTVYTHMISSAHRTLADVSTDSVNAANPDFAIDLSLDLGLNGEEYTLTVKTKYKDKDASALMMSAELKSKENGVIVLGAYYGKPASAEGTDKHLYVKINDGESGKLKFEISEDNGLADFFPIKNFDVTGVKTYAQAFASILGTKGSGITGQERSFGNIKEYKYSINVDVPKTVRKIAELFAGSSSATDIFDSLFETEEDRDAVERILSSVLGVSIADLNQHSTFPACDLIINFETSDTKITALDVEFNVAGNVDSTVFGGEGLELDIALNSIVIDKSYTKVSIPFFGENEYQQYKNFISKSSDIADLSAYGIALNILSTNIDTNKKENLNVRVEFSLNETESTANEFLFELTKAEEAILGLYLKNNVLYVYAEVNDEYQQYKHYEGVDIISIFDELKEGISTVTNNKLGVLEVVSNLVSAIKINKDAIELTVTEDLINIFVPDLDDFLAFVDDVLGDNLNMNDELDDNEVDIPDYIKKHELKITIDFDKESPFVYELDGEIDFGDYVPD